MYPDQWGESLREWSERNPIGVVLFASLIITLLFVGTGGLLPILGFTILLIMLADRAWKYTKNLISEHSTEKSSLQTEQDPLSELRERYARGEISDDEFENRVEKLLQTETPERADGLSDREPVTEES